MEAFRSVSITSQSTLAFFMFIGELFSDAESGTVTIAAMMR
jgi:hypothetical protein